MTLIPPVSSILGLRDLYMRHLTTPVEAPRKGSVAGKETRRGMRQGAIWEAMTQTSWQALEHAWLATPQKVFVWSDHHLGHDKIIQYTDRPFGGSGHMDISLIANAFAEVRSDDWLVFVGDIAIWKEPGRIRDWLKLCPGRKVLVLGNHDLRGRDRPMTVEAWQALGFEAVADVARLPAAHGTPELWLTHYPLPDAMIPEDVLNVHGHTHRHLMGGQHANVCVEHLDYRPRLLVDRANPINIG